MKATLTFDLREDQHTFDCMMNAINMHSVLLELREHLRALEKYQNLTEKQETIVVELREWLHGEIQTQGLSHLL
jgi:hypothetical protein